MVPALSLAGIRLQMTLRRYCNDHFYGPTCGVYCEEVDKAGIGHFICDSDGNKVCLPGEEGEAEPRRVRGRLKPPERSGLGWSSSQVTTSDEAFHGPFEPRVHLSSAEPQMDPTLFQFGAQLGGRLITAENAAAATISSSPKSLFSLSGSSSASVLSQARSKT
ncbi:unnamed protein product [Protopolystoma xenopodis]|uniref:Delta-like protein n=1 Tax=Protopolystoma xenopodis TaxID=117903 RepID=A0A3S5B6R2_9PLAT|nr:unnamed protein product [Protopolystoma xenopodis]